MGGRVPRGEPKKSAPGWVGDYQVPAQTGAHNAIIADLAMPVVPAPRGGRTSLRGVLVVGDRRRVGDPRTAVACAGQHGRPRRTTREALPPVIVDAILDIVRGGIAWRQLPVEFPPAATGYAVFARSAAPGVAAHPRRAARPTAGAGRAGPVPDRGDHRLADATAADTCPDPAAAGMAARERTASRGTSPWMGMAAARRRRHRRLDPGPRRRTPTPGHTARQLLHHPAGLGRRRLPRTVAHLGERRSHPYYADHQTHPRRHWFHVRPRIWVVERVSRGSTSTAAACATTKRDPTTTKPWSTSP